MITVGRISKYLCDDKYSGGYSYDGSNNYYDEILEFVPITGEWELVDRMMKARDAHAVSVITFEAGLCF